MLLFDFIVIFIQSLNISFINWQFQQLVYAVNFINNYKMECHSCGQTDQLVQICCPSGLSYCQDCILNGKASVQTKCINCNLKYGKKFSAAVNQIFQRRDSLNMQISQQNSLNMTQKKMRGQQTYQHTNYMNNNFGAQMPYNQSQMGYTGGFQSNMHLGNMQNMQNMQNMGFMHPMGMMPNYLPNWQSNYPNFPPMMFPQNFNQNLQIQQQNSSMRQKQYQAEKNYQNPYIENDFQQQSYNRLMKSATRGINCYKPSNDCDDQDKPQRCWIGEYVSKNQSKTTDSLQQSTTTRNKSVKINRSSSVNNLTMRRS